MRMSLKHSALTLLSLLFLLPWLHSCSTLSSEVGRFDPFELDKFLPSVTKMLKSASACQDAEWFREHLSRYRPHKELYLIYLIGSVAVSSKVDETALDVLHGLYEAKENEYLLDLLNELKKENSHDTVAKFISDSIWSTRHVSFPGFMIMELMVKQWPVMKALTLRILDIMKSPYNHYDRYRFTLATLSIDQQPEIAVSLQNRSCAADKLMYDYISERTTAPPLLEVLTLDAAAWQSIFRFLDVPTLLGKLPLVCKSWRVGLYQMILACDAGLIRRLSLTWCYKTFADVFWGPPCRCRLEIDDFAARYFGWCIMNGALDGIRPDHSLQLRVIEYLQRVTYNQDLLPEVGNCTLCESFLALFVKACALCIDDKPAFDRPVFLTDDEYEQAVRYLLLKGGYVLKLCPVLMADLARVFAMIGEDEVLMIELIKLNFGGLHESSLILTVRGQAHDLPEKLKSLLSPPSANTSARPITARQRRTARHNERHISIASSDFFGALVERTRSVDRFYLFLTSLILCLREDRGKIDKVMASLNGHHLPHSCQDMNPARAALEKGLETVNKGDDYTLDEIQFIMENVLKLQSTSQKKALLL